MTVETVSDAVARRVRDARKARGWQSGDLAGVCARNGHPEITENVIENIESGRRKDGRRTRAVTADEIVALAEALDVSPAELLGVPLGKVTGLDFRALEQVADTLKTFASVQRWRAENES